VSLCGDIEMDNMTSELIIAEKHGDDARLGLTGCWRYAGDAEYSSLDNCLATSPTSLAIDGDSISDWGNALVCFLFVLRSRCGEAGIDVNLENIPAGALQLLNLAEAVPEREGADQSGNGNSFFERMGETAMAIFEDLYDTLEFLGASTVAAGKFIRLRTQFKLSDMVIFMKDCGPEAFSIITLITFLVGLILAFVGAIQLRLFGAQIFVADLVGIGMVRELGAIMAAIVMAGRTGAAYAAQLGTMQVNEEVDALKTMGFSPIEFLVLPRVFALIIIMPMLCIYADLMGVLGGMFVGVFMLDISPLQYYQQSIDAIRMQDFCIGMFMSLVFGILVAGAGCLRGLQCGRSSAAVGKAATSAVFTGNVWVIVSTAVITIICDVLGI